MGDYLEFTKDIPSPPVFRLWTAIHAVGAAAERRLWTPLGINRLYPNLFVFLVGPPGVGKTQAINPMSVLLRKSQSTTIAPNDITKQGLLDALAQCHHGSTYLGRPFDYHYMALCIAELSNFMSKYDDALAGILTDLFDCPPVNEERKRSGAGEAIVNPGISMLVGTATQNLGHTISNEMWGSGFMARVIMVYSADEVIPEDMFAVNEADEPLAARITQRLRAIGELCGPIGWNSEARAVLSHFRRHQKDGAPLHNRMSHYVTRRWLHFAKLCMIAALSDEPTGDPKLAPIVTHAHTDLAMEWLLAAEHEATEVFKGMISHEDGAVYEELRNLITGLHMRSGRSAVHASVIYEFLSSRVAAYQVPRIIEIAEAAGFLLRQAGTEGHDAMYVPKSGLGVGGAGVL